MKSEIIGLVGESGAGKSTLLAVLAGLSPYEGSILFNNQEVSKFHDKLIKGVPGVEFVHQDGNLYPLLSVYENVTYPVRTHADEEVQNQYAELEYIFRLTGLRNKPVKNLSGGEVQRVAMAKAMVSDIELLLLDEPFSHQDMLHRSTMLAYIIKTVRQKKCALIMASHHPATIFMASHKLIVLKNGKLIHFEESSKLYKSPGDLYTYALLGDFAVFTQGSAKIGFRPGQLRFGNGELNMKVKVIHRTINDAMYGYLVEEENGQVFQLFSARFVKIGSYEVVTAEESKGVVLDNNGQSG